MGTHASFSLTSLLRLSTMRDELRVLLHRLEVSTAPEDQLLRYDVLQAAVSLLRHCSRALYELVLVAFSP